MHGNSWQRRKKLRFVAFRSASAPAVSGAGSLMLCSIERTHELNWMALDSGFIKHAMQKTFEL